jgi:hypothetical protein
VRLYSAHVKANAEPVLVREGFSWGALIFGPLWLALHRAWSAAAIDLAAFMLIGFLLSTPLCVILAIALAVLLGLIGHDLRCWSMEHRGYLVIHVVAARGAEEALQRLLTYRPDLAGRFMREVGR